MSDLPSEARDWRLYIQEMIKCGERALSYVQGLDIDSFISDSRTYDATLRNIELIGEFATRVPDNVQEAHPEIQWRSIIGARQHMAHGSLTLDNDIVWDIVQNDIPSLLRQLRNLLDLVEHEEKH